MSEKRTYSTSGPQCPYCGHEITPDDPGFYSDRYTEETCPDCGQQFSVEVSHFTSWACEEISE